MITLPSYIENSAAYKPGQSIEEIREKYGLTDLIKLASNENPLGASPIALEYAKQAVEKAHIYNDGGLALRQAIAHRFGVERDQVVCHNGSDALIHTAIRAFTDPEHDVLLSSQGTFAGFTVASSLSGAKKRLVPLTKDYRFDVDALADAIEPATKILYIANANNPTGTYITGEEYERLMARVPDTVLVIMDEAYFEYSRDLEHDYPDSLSYTYPNVLTLRTFSKVYGLASLRIGYGIASPQIIDAMLRVKLSFDPTGPGAAAGLGALLDDEFLRATVEMNSSELRRIYAKALEWGLRVPYPAANFIMIECFSTENAQALYERLLRKGIITRPLQGFGMPTCVRISTGTPMQNDRMLATLEECIADMPELIINEQ